MPADPSTTDRRADAGSPTLPLVGLVMGAWAIIPPYLGAFGELDVESRVEFADHVVPGIVVLAVAALSFLTLRSREPSQMLLFVGGGLITLAGFWMVATHFPLIQQGQDGVSPWGTIAWHSVPGVVVTLFGLLWTIRFWGSDEADDGAPSGR
jgi:hypothetical protein